MCQGLNSHCFPMVGMVINLIVGFYIPIIRIPIKGGMTIPNARSLDPGTYTLNNQFFFHCSLVFGRKNLQDGASLQAIRAPGGSSGDLGCDRYLFLDS